MELYILSKQDLSILSICKLADYQINLDEETNAKSTFTLMKTNGLKKENYMVLNGLYRQFIFVIDDVQTEKGSNVVAVTALDISNIFDRKVIEKNIDTMKSKSIEEFLANTISENFVNSDDTALNVNYIEIYWHTNTKGNVATNAENGLYNFHTFLINCRQYKNIYTDFKLENLGNPQTAEGKRISVEAKNRKIVDISLHGESIQEGTPTPDNRVEIENIEGKNLFDGNKSEWGKYNVWQHNTGNYANAFVNVINIKGLNKCSISFKNNTRTFRFGYQFIDDNENYLSGVYWSTSTNRKVFANISVPENASKIIISQLDGQKEDDIEIQLEEGTVATPYVPYNSLEFKDEGENLYNDNIDNYNKPIDYWICPVALEQGETYKLSGKLKGTEMTGCVVAVVPYGNSYDEFKYVISRYIALDTSGAVSNRTITVDSTFTSPKLVIYAKNKEIFKSIFGNYEIQLNKGTVAKAYEPYKQQTKCFPLSEGQKLMEGSYLADDGIHHNFKEGLANGTSTTFEDAKENGKFYCNQKASGNLEGKTIAFDTEVTDAIVQYELAEEEIVPYTETQQEAWNKIKNLTLFEGVNHISSDANMVLKYYPLKPVGLKFILRIDIENKQETTELIDTTLPEVTDYNKIYEEDVTAKVQVYIREDESEYNLYLKTDRTTTTNKDDPDRASGKIEVISVDTADKAEEEALNVMKGNNYKHLVEFKIAKTSKLMDITQLHIGRPIRIKTYDDIYDSYISAITLSDENFVYFKSGSLRITLLDKLKKSNDSAGNKLDVSGGKITGNLNILDNAYFGKNGVAFGAPYDTNEGGSLQVDGKDILKKNILLDSTIERIITGILTPASGANVLASTYVAVGKIIVIGLDLTAVEQISQYQPIAYFNNGGLLGNGYIYTTANEACYLSKDKQSIDIYKSGGLAAGEKVYINAVAILNS